MYTSLTLVVGTHNDKNNITIYHIKVLIFTSIFITIKTYVITEKRILRRCVSVTEIVVIEKISCTVNHGSLEH